jgi:hypothetical protein
MGKSFLQLSCDCIWQIIILSLDFQFSIPHSRMNTLSWPNGLRNGLMRQLGSRGRCTISGTNLETQNRPQDHQETDQQG